MSTTLEAVQEQKPAVGQRIAKWLRGDQPTGAYKQAAQKEAEHDGEIEILPRSDLERAGRTPEESVQDVKNLRRLRRAKQDKLDAAERDKQADEIPDDPAGTGTRELGPGYVDLQAAKHRRRALRSEATVMRTEANRVIADLCVKADTSKLHKKREEHQRRLDRLQATLTLVQKRNRLVEVLYDSQAPRSQKVEAKRQIRHYEAALSGDTAEAIDAKMKKEREAIDDCNRQIGAASRRSIEKAEYDWTLVVQE